MKRIIKIIFVLVALYGAFLAITNIAVNSWMTNAESSMIDIDEVDMSSIPASMWEVHKYIADHPKEAYDILETYSYLNGTWGNDTWFPANNGGIDFVVKWAYTRKAFANSISYWSKKLNIDPDLVMACVLGEQIRIANKWARWNLKDIVNWMTPRLLRSYNTSLGIGGIKLTTAKDIKKNTIDYGMWEYVKDDVLTSSWLADNDALNAKYATFLVYNIMTRWIEDWHNISDKPWVICTLYNMWNAKEKAPHANPLIGGSVIRVGKKNFVYGWLAQWAYRYLKIYSDKK